MDLSCKTLACHKGEAFKLANYIPIIASLNLRYGI